MGRLQKIDHFVSINKISHFLTWLKKMPTFHSEIQHIILFGSFARGDATDISDIDLAISLTNATPWSTIAEKIRENKLTLKKIDLICLEKISEKFKKKILKEGITIYERS